VKWKQAERIAEWIVEDADVHAGLRSCRERLSVRTADGVGPDDVVLEQDLRFGVLDQLEHRGEGVGAVSQQSHAIGARERTPGHLGQPGLEPGIERPGGLETPGRLDRLEGDRCPPLTCVLVAGDAHPAALFQERPHAGGAIRG
jgi:hypothetical protein